MTNTDNNYLTDENKEELFYSLVYNTETRSWPEYPKVTYDYLVGCEESIIQIREYLEVMKNEPEGYILMSKVYHSIRRMLGDEG